MVKELLEKQITEEFEEKGLGNLIAYFMAKYPNYPCADLEVQKLNSEHLKHYDIPFLASYIRYSDIELLGSGIRDSNIKEKLCFLHKHIGTISKEYRKFIWSEMIDLEDLKRWITLLIDPKIKNRIMKCTKITEELKSFIDHCLDLNSYSYQILVHLDQLYPNVSFELQDIAQLQDQMSFFKLLNMIRDHKETISYSELLNCFYKIKQLLKIISTEEVSKYWVLLKEYLREPSYKPMISTIAEFGQFRQEKEKAHLDFIENEYDVSKLKNFFSRLFLGMNYELFKDIFSKLPLSDDPRYLLLKKFDQALFPLSLKNDLYYQFMKYGDLRSYLEQQISVSEVILELELQQSVPDEVDTSISMMRNSQFVFLTMSLEEYKKQVSQKNEIVKATLQTEWSFKYEENQCLLAFPSSSLLSYHDQTCLLKGKNLHPTCIIGFDIVSFLHLKEREELDLPIVLIDTEYYAQKNNNELEQLKASGNWDLYLLKKKQLFESLKNHPWVLQKFFNKNQLYADIEQFKEHFSSWIEEDISYDFLKTELHILQRLLELDDQLSKQYPTNVQESKIEYQDQIKEYDQILNSI